MDGCPVEISERRSFYEFSGFIRRYGLDKGAGGIRGSESVDKQRNRAYLVERIQPIFNGRFPGRNRFGGRAFHARGMGPALLNGRYGHHDRSIILFFENVGTQGDVQLVVREWWLFEHDRPVEVMKGWLKRHEVDEKYHCTQEAIDKGIVQIFREDVRAEG